MSGKASTEIPTDVPHEDLDEATYDRLFQALANGTRRRILDLLRDHPCTTGELCAQFPALDRCTTM